MVQSLKDSLVSSAENTTFDILSSVSLTVREDVSPMEDKLEGSTKDDVLALIEEQFDNTYTDVEDSEYLQKGSIVHWGEYEEDYTNINMWRSTDNGIVEYNYTKGFTAYVHDGEDYEKVDESHHLLLRSLQHAMSSRRYDARVGGDIPEDAWSDFVWTVTDRLDEEVIDMMKEIEFPEGLVLLTYKNKYWWVVQRVYEVDTTIYYSEDEDYAEDDYVWAYVTRCSATTSFDDIVISKLEEIKNSIVYDVLETYKTRQLLNEGVTDE